MKSLDRALLDLAHSPELLVASDYDGTLAPIVDDPDQAHPHREALVALRNLALLPHTHVAIISGRSLRDLAAFVGEAGGMHLVGSHGSEFDPDFLQALAPEALALHAELKKGLLEASERLPGSQVELKPASVAFHYRNADADLAVPILEAIESGLAQRDGVTIKRGKMVLELAVVGTDKGDALHRLRGRLGATAVAFLGDDITDEDAFATLSGPDFDVKVGEGESAARWRVEDPEAVARVLARLCELRTAWLLGEDAFPIESLGFLSDQRSAALIAPDGDLLWMCAPRLDSPALFASLLGGPGDGHFRVGPVDPTIGRQSWLGDSLVLETRWSGISLLDALDISKGRAFQRPGRCDLIRLLQVEKGKSCEAVFAPRLDFGRVESRLQIVEGGLQLEGSFDPVVLASPGIEWEIRTDGSHQTAYATLEGRDEPWLLELRYGSGQLAASSARALEKITATRRNWERWIEELTLPESYEETLKRSALALRGLCYGPTGAIAAAATTSLPEQIGGGRNWDYRYCWLRDGAMTASALLQLGSQREAMRFLDWVLDIVEDSASPERLHPLYALDGGELQPEAEIASLSGYRGSRPVRVGNAASQQVQLDVFGPVVELVESLLRKEAPLGGEHWRLVQKMVAAVEARWTEADHGIWEVRTGLRHHVHSKLMGWLTVDRALAIAPNFDRSQIPAWTLLRDSIRDDILTHGVDEKNGRLRAFYGSDHADASVLLVGLKGMIDPKSELFRNTVDFIESELCEDNLVWRYRYEDGLAGHEGGWFLCTAWLAESRLLLGERDRAEELVESMLSRAGRLGLLPEQFDPAEGRGLGNYPQAFSHIGLIEAILALGA